MLKLSFFKKKKRQEDSKENSSAEKSSIKTEDNTADEIETEENRQDQTAEQDQVITGNSITDFSRLVEDPLFKFEIESKEKFEEQYDFIFNRLDQQKKEYLIKYDIFYIEHKKTGKTILLIHDFQHINFKMLFSEFDFDELRYIDQRTLYILLNQNISELKSIEQSSLDFVLDLLRKAKISGVSDIYLYLRDLTFTVAFRTALGIEKLGEWGIKQATAVRHTLEYLANEEANTRLFDKKITFDRSEFRINFFETVSGFDCTIRSYADNIQGALTLKNLGYTDRIINIIESICLNQNGLILYTAQTGQGKTTSQYANLLWLSEERKLRVVTVENPVEKRFSSMAQIDLSEYLNADEKYRITGKDALKLFLRARPDVINMGEIRDEEEAQLAYTASITGHLVFGTLHTNSVITAIKRLEKTGLSEDDIKATVRGIIYQQLVRQLCPDCKILEEEGTDENGNRYTRYRANPKGCPRCRCGYSLLKTPVVEIAEFSALKEFDFYDTSSYEVYVSLEDSAREKYNLGYIDKIHYDAIRLGRREPRIDCESKE